MADLKDGATPGAGSWNRRDFLKGLGTVGATGAVAAAAPAALAQTGAAGDLGLDFQQGLEGDLLALGQERKRASFLLRSALARRHFRMELPDQPDNGDEERYPDRRASFSKPLPHNALGEVDVAEYDKMADALDNGDLDALARVELADGALARLANPSAAFSFQTEGKDPHAFFMPAPPAFASAGIAAEMGELYWKALARDVPFRNYDVDPVIQDAIADLNDFSATVGPKVNGQVTVDTIFRGFTGGDRVGPFISQLLWLPYGFGLIEAVQRYRFPVAGTVNDFMADFDTWLAVQNGAGRAGQSTTKENTGRYMSTARDLAEFVHVDVSYQAYLHAALILLSYGDAAGPPNNPYQEIPNQGAFSTFGGPDVVDMVARAANAALRASWYHKWLVHRRLRPEAYGGRLEVHLSGQKTYDLHPDILNSEAVARTQSVYGTALLSQAFPEGSPTHPSYPAGHAVLSGACATILKAFFNEGFVIPNAVQATADGDALEPWDGADLTIGGEINKLASNVTLGRDWAGVHYRSDGDDGMRLGERVALNLLADYVQLYPETFDGFVVQTFDGDVVNIRKEEITGWSLNGRPRA